MSKPSQEHLKKADQLFKQLDVNKDGRISVEELAQVIQSPHLSSSVKDKLEHARKIITKGRRSHSTESSTTNNNQPTLTFDEFVTYIRDTETQLKLAFQQLDQNNDQQIEVTEIQQGMKKLGIDVSLTEAEKLLKRIDKDGSMTIDYDEWRDFLLFSGTSKIDEIFRYWKRASAIDLGENMVVPDDFSDEEKKAGDAWKTLVAGGLSGCVSRSVTAPLDRIKLTWQALGNKAAHLGLVGTLRKMLKEGGASSLWRGNGVNCLKIAPESAIKFQAYELYKSLIGPSFGNPASSQQVNIQTKFVSGALAGATSQTIIYPMEVLKTRMALRTSGQYSSIFDCACKLYAESGWLIFYRGYVPNLIGILPYAGIELAMFETFKQSYVRLTSPADEAGTDDTNSPPPVYVSVTAGALSSVCGQLATYPLALARTKLQAQTTKSSKIGFVAVMRNIVKYEGPSGLFRGLGPNMLKVIPAVSVSYACFDQLRGLLHFGK